MQWNPSCEDTPFAPEMLPFKRDGLSSGVSQKRFHCIQKFLNDHGSSQQMMINAHDQYFYRYEIKLMAHKCKHMINIYTVSVC